MFVKRFAKNPIVAPDTGLPWQATAVFNGCPVDSGDKTYLVYRAISEHPMVSTIGIAESPDGVDFHYHKQFITPEYPWEKYGCEDPRVTRVSGTYYIFYTALSDNPPSAAGIKVAVALSDDMQSVREKHLVTPFNAKAMAMFPETIAGKLWAMVTVHTDQPPVSICLASFDRESDLWNPEYWQAWYAHYKDFSLPLQRRPEDHIEVGAPPLKTAEGWLVFYSYIKNYRSPKPLFSVEAVLLDSADPLKIIGRTDVPLMAPEEPYETIGLVPNIVFPSGALLAGNDVHLYYGAADTTCCRADIKLDALLRRMTATGKQIIKLDRCRENPIITPNPLHAWESKAVFNPGAILIDGAVHLLYRAMSRDNTSVFGYAKSEDGVHVSYRSPDPVYVSGCEDPRLTKIGDRIYMLYTAYDGKHAPRVAITWIGVSDFLKQIWHWAPPVCISPPGVDDKDACLFPEQFDGNYFIVHRSGDDIDLARAPTLDFDGNTWLEDTRWIMRRKGMWDDKKIGLAAPPVKTEKGWILLYHGISGEDGFYRVGACLLDLKNPIDVIARLDTPVFEPEAEYEKNGIVPNVVFPCGAVVLGERLFVYYGGADKVVCASSVLLADLLHAFEF